MLYVQTYHWTGVGKRYKYMLLSDLLEKMEETEIVKRINRLKAEKNAILLVHNYQRQEIYQVADFIGDSLELSREAAKTNADIIVFCGVYFMAESAYILNPNKKVLIPVKARCPMAATATPENVRAMKKAYPNAAVVSYINTTAAVKAESDICCTSSNAVKVVNSMEQEKIIFVPDYNLAHYVAQHTHKTIIPWTGYCYVHHNFSSQALKKAKTLHPDAEVVVHPECSAEVIKEADGVASTSGMLHYIQKSNATQFIIGTEIGLIERMKLECPEKTFYQAPPGGVCIQMKNNSLELTLASLEFERYEVSVPDEISSRARQALERMLEISW
jgi:quinolinate synthase